nr:MAG TPA_asm: hypothetical protein [Caudoviricetes sp.]
MVALLSSGGPTPRRHHKTRFLEGIGPRSIARRRAL